MGVSMHVRMMGIIVLVDGKVNLEVSNGTITFPMTSSFCWRQQFHDMTSSIFCRKLVSHWSDHNFSTTNDWEVIDPSLERYQEGACAKWFFNPPPICRKICLCQHFSQQFLAIFRQNPDRWRHAPPPTTTTTNHISDLGGGMPYLRWVLR